jgi:acetyl-CoA carboxylase biotin carboxyl carrier protein
MSLTNEDVQEILTLLDELDATELHLRTRHFTLSVRRAGGAGGWVQASSVRSDPQLLPDPAPPPAADPPAGVPDRPDGPDSGGLVAVRTPLMGTFYRAPKPGAPPFVEVGDRVEAETVVGIVETMKLMNSVHAGAGGRVAEICLADAEPAAPGAVLMRIAPEPGR